MRQSNGFNQANGGNRGLETDARGIGSAALGDLSEEMTPAETAAVIGAGNEFAQEVSKGQPDTAPCLLISGQLGYYPEAEDMLFENRVKQSCLDALGYPPLDPEPSRPAINVLLDSGGGMLDSAFKIVLYLFRYARELKVYVPRRAKSASTLIALGASHVYLSPFGELGPLDTQIDDPRFAKKAVSALDFYQSVDYVRSFGFHTMEEGLDKLVSNVGAHMSQHDLLQQAADFALGSVTPMMDAVKALDFGGWGRSLKIGEKYAQILLHRNNYDEKRARSIASRLVYGYTHHPFPIDYIEACDIGLAAEMMEKDACQKADHLVETCKDKAFVGFISKHEADAEADAKLPRSVSHISGRSTSVKRGDQTPPVANVPTPTGKPPSLDNPPTPI